MTDRPPTLHRLLWGVRESPIPIAEWGIRAWEVPAVGLPARIAYYLLEAVQGAGVPAGWGPKQGPLAWQILDADPLLTSGRQFQFGYLEKLPDQHIPVASGDALPGVARTASWEVPPHEAYFLPMLAVEDPDHIDSKSYLAYCDVLLLLTAMDGGEAILDSLAARGAGAVPFEERWGWRSRIHLPREVWQRIEKILRWAGGPSEPLIVAPRALRQDIERWVPKVLNWADFAFERIDVRLGTASDIEVVRAIRSPGSTDPALPRGLFIEESALREKLVVRIGQLSSWPDDRTVVDNFPAVDQPTTDQIMEQVAAAFQTPDHGRNHDPSLVLLPEVSIPQPEVQTVRDLVAQSGRASLAGLYWRLLPPSYPRAKTTRPTRQWFVNEAELVLPIVHDDRGPTGVRWYRVRKPMPAHVEKGLAKALTRVRGGTWRVLSGDRWYRFVHPTWGDFTIAICSDLLDTAPWRSMHGELLHLFMVGFNRDVDLYDSLTWVRAYENYVNLVAVNHGHYGGSFLWTPRREHNKELARLRGGKLMLLADVELPVLALARQQQIGVDCAVRAADKAWRCAAPTRSDFKAPPPGYERRSLT